MEAVGARLGRSSSRYGTNTTVFSGRVRKWKKGWIPITPPSSSNHQNHPPSSSSSALPNGDSAAAAAASGTQEIVSHLRFFKWAPVTLTGTDKENSNVDDDGGLAKEVPISVDAPRRKFKYIPIAVLEEQKKEAEETTNDDIKTAEEVENTAEETSKSDAREEKPDINDMPMEEETQEENQTATELQDLNQSFDLT